MTTRRWRWASVAVLVAVGLLLLLLTDFSFVALLILTAGAAGGRSEWKRVDPATHFRLSQRSGLDPSAYGGSSGDDPPG